VASSQLQSARTALDAWVREVVAWHFDPATGSPFWLDYAKKLGWDPRQRISGFDDLQLFESFEDEWLRGGPVQRWVPRGLAGKPVFVFETGGTTGVPKTRINCEDFGSTTKSSARHCPTSTSRRRQLADARAVGSRALARGRAPDTAAGIAFVSISIRAG
jgi:hypothetical protein